MAQRHATPLGDFPCFLGAFDEDLDGHVQLFEVTCGAHEIVEDSKKLRIFPATLRGDASEWYANLGMHERTTYDDLKTNFLRKFRGLGFEEKLAEELDHVRQGPNESIDKYIDRMNTIVRKLGNSAPDGETLKRRFLVGLHDEKVEQYIRLKRPSSLDETKHEARAWEEVQYVLQMHRDRLISHSRGLGENQESSKIVEITEAKVGVLPRARIIRSEGRTGGDGKPKKQEPMHARDKDEHKNDAIITSQIVAQVECEALKDVGLQCKVQKLECELEKLRDVVSHLERELAQEKANRMQQVEKVKDVERVAHEWFKDTQDIWDKENKRIDQLMQENEGFRELTKRWEIDRKIQREKIVNEMEKRGELERKVEVLMGRAETLEKTKIGKIASKGKEERLGFRHVEIEGCGTKKEVETKVRVSGERVEVSEKGKENGIETRKKTTTSTESSEQNMKTPIVKRILKKNETSDLGRKCKGTIGECKEKKKGSLRILAKEIDYNDRKCVKQGDKELGDGNALTMDQEVRRKDTFSKQMNVLYEKTERERKDVTEGAQKYNDLHDAVSDLEKKTPENMWLCRMNPCFEKDEHFEEDERL
ncbi:hypothetical protein KP509_07G021500 [Ceratopteris richardii]|uniref:Retrotransposon gag domain-containing protein n=1 Tax=Ceratopteris richardii TaxID=49495 RepID=A0A8T2UJ93_CERRI|nr:hypothetical protein KP509_07G021500 [Ceratopteris richardii]